jgi:predicted transcriptional regulator
MAVISLRLPPELEEILAREAERAGRPRSEMAREAIADYLNRQRRDRFIAEIARAARAIDPAEAVAVAEEALPLDNEALSIGEGSSTGSKARARRGKRLRKR